MRIISKSVIPAAAPGTTFGSYWGGAAGRGVFCTPIDTRSFWGFDRIDQSLGAALDGQLVLDSYGTHKHQAVKQWLAERPRCHVHFTPTSSSWLNKIERWFAEITRKQIRRGTFRSVRDLSKIIADYIRH